MAITKTEVLQRCEVYPASDPTADPATNDANPRLMIVMHITFDDPDDAELPTTSDHAFGLSRYDSEGNPTDVSGYVQLVQDICAAVWS